MIKRYQAILTIAGIIIAMGIVGQSDYEEEQRQTVQYCEMVKLWKQTDGQAGWPAYDGEEVCNTCDHSVGVCMCDYWNMRRKMKAALSKENRND